LLALQEEHENVLEDFESYKRTLKDTEEECLRYERERNEALEEVEELHVEVEDMYDLIPPRYKDF